MTLRSPSLLFTEGPRTLLYVHADGQPPRACGQVLQWGTLTTKLGVLFRASKRHSLFSYGWAQNRAWPWDCLPSDTVEYDVGHTARLYHFIQGRRNITDIQLDPGWSRNHSDHFILWFSHSLLPKTKRQWGGSGFLPQIQFEDSDYPISKQPYRVKNPLYWKMPGWRDEYVSLSSRHDLVLHPQDSLVTLYVPILCLL